MTVPSPHHPFSVPFSATPGTSEGGWGVTGGWDECWARVMNRAGRAPCTLR
eukprot:NODE_6384_length_329_cov_49.982143_g5232_i0.p2 GENE.NODE_6384_length_329_cov_49.982143_g5232_i0~~NODE_6384_length_329_cov_49.982143_g5232_i0.p2  ORF type:complete len:51 (+),score=21.29 NODE_6384_length_329_cov_49.982143_g5232_i0:173-325(+)